MFERKSFDKPWKGKIPPSKIVGNVYFVGTFPASTHIIRTDGGIILIDPGYMETLHLVIDSIYSLGFSPYDIKYIINTHWHSDHTAATAALADLTGAKTVIGRYDEEKVLRFFKPDIIVKDGDIITLGGTAVRIMETPGHTRGTISFFFRTTENGVSYNVGMFGGAGANTLADGHFDYDGCREDYRRSLAKLRNEKVDVFIGNHVWNNDTENKINILRQTGENKFIDSRLWETFLDFCEKRLDRAIQASQAK